MPVVVRERGYWGKQRGKKPVTPPKPKGTGKGK